jgi:arylsulfatase A-like enzyme/Tfp pilus assembly protein PilF
VIRWLRTGTEKLGLGILLAAAWIYSSATSLPVRSVQSISPKSGLNLLLITIDTLRADRVSIYGDKHLRTPNFDSLAMKGTVFMRAFAHTSTTLPSHTNILLGATPNYHGVHDNANFIVRDEFLTLAEHLKSYGYSTGAFIGGFPLDSRFGLGQGFDTYDDYFGLGSGGLKEGGEKKAQAVLDSALKWLKAQESPWFLWVHFFDPHDPYDPPEPFKKQFGRYLYDGEVAYTDSVTGNLIRYLETNGLFKKTCIVFTADHGESLTEHGEKTHGYLSYNTTIWVPFFIVHPDFEHRVVDQNVAHIDIFPTVCDVLGIKKPDRLQGNSLLPLLKGKTLDEQPIYFESLSAFYNMGWAPIRGYVLRADKFVDSPVAELYDLKKDFDETDNLAGGKNLDAYKRQLDEIVRRQSSAERLKAEQRMSRETQERLRSLGYLAGSKSSGKKTFGPEDDVKRLLPYHNKSMEALELFRAGKPREAAAALKEVIMAKKNISASYLNLALIYGSQKRLDDAIAVLRLGLEAMPENYDIYSQYIASLYEAGRYEEVVKAFGKGAPPQVELDPVIWNYIGLAHLKMGDTQKAQQAYEKSLSIDKEFAVTYNNLGVLYYSIFKKTNDPGAYQMAVKNYQKAIELDPAYSPSFHGLGVTFLQGGNYAGAIANLEKALELEPGLDEALYFLGLADLQAGNTAKAYDYFMKFKNTLSYSLLSAAEKERIEGYIAKCRKDG